MTKKNPDEFEQEIAELTADLQRERANFENYRRRVDEEKQMAREYGEAATAAKLLPIIDDIERAATHLPAELNDNAWAQGVAGLAKNLDKMLETIGVARILAEPDAPFNPDQHHAVQFDENSTGDTEVVAEELQPGYLLNGQVLRPAMVKVKRR
jgi:molecular chaperone GrpE